MAETSPIVNRADPTQRRRRSFVASKNETPPAIPQENPVEKENIEDIPVLTEVVAEETLMPEEPAGHATEAQDLLLASDIAQAIGEQLTRDLPELLETVLQDAGENLRAGITATMETALRDFITRRKQLQLPLEDSD